MAEESIPYFYCGYNTTSLRTEKLCPACGRRLRVTGSLQRITLRLSCLDCGYQSKQLSTEEVQALVD